MNLREFFSENKKLAIAFSGGVDSAFLLSEAVKSGCDVIAYYVKTEFQPLFEFQDALRLAKELGAVMKVINVKALDDADVTANGPKRCYFCKKRIFGSILAYAQKDGYSIICDGTNASDDISDRPGFVALQEMKVLSPLRDCGLKKDDIRRLSKESGLFTWNKPAYACLATRIPTGTVLTGKDLEITEKSEAFLFDLGFSDFRIRKNGETARIQVKAKDMEKLIQERDKILPELKKYYKAIVMDLEER